MPQITKVIDLKRSLLVTPEEIFPENLSFTAREDSPEQEFPILAYQARNVLPTAYGYQSYFGLNSTLDLTSLEAVADELLLYQFPSYANILVALCDTGIWVARGNATGGSWTQAITLSAPPSGTFLPWTFCVIENVLYMYRQGAAKYYTLDGDSFDIGTEEVTVNEVTPTFLNMAGQMGIFRANGRLGFWDSENSVSWSSVFDQSDFEPSVETLAGNAIFNDVLGRISHILSQGTGFIIYATKSITGVRYQADSTQIWAARSISDVAGVLFKREVATGLDDIQHFAWTSVGLKKIGGYNYSTGTHSFEEVATEIYDQLRMSRAPVYLKLLQGRYLAIFSTDQFVTSTTSFSTETVPGRISFYVNGRPWGEEDDLPGDLTDRQAGTAAGATLSYVPQTTRGYELRAWTGTLKEVHPSEILPDPLEEEWVELDGNIGFTATDEATPGIVWPLQGRPDTETHAVMPSLVSLIGKQLGYFAAAQAEQAINLARIAAYELVDVTTDYGIYSTSQTMGSGQWATTTVDTDVGYIYTGQGGIDWQVGRAGDDFGQKYCNVVKHYQERKKIVKRVVTSYSQRILAGGYKLHYSTPLKSFPYGYGPCTIVPAFPSAPSDGHGVKTGAAFTVEEAETRLASWIAIGRVLQLSSCTDAYAVITSFSRSGSGTVGSNWEWTASFSYYGSSYAGQNASIVISTYNESLSQTYHVDKTVTSSYLLVTEPESDYGETRAYFYELNKDYVTVLNGQITINTSESMGTMTVPYTSLTPEYDPDAATFTWGENTYVLPWDLESKTFKLEGQDIQLEDLPDGLVMDPPIADSGYSLAFGESYTYNSPGLEFSFPDTTFLLQEGYPVPLDPTFVGAWIYDLSLKKWGNFTTPDGFKLLLDYQPINIGAPLLSHTNFGLDSGILNPEGDLQVFDSRPADSFLVYGKIGLYRGGFTTPQSVRADFRSETSEASVGTVCSLDGRSIDATLTEATAAEGDTYQLVHYPSYSSQWFSISISGIFDLTHLEFTATIGGRR